MMMLTYPERLLAREVRVAAPPPEPAGHEATLLVALGPLDARARPLRAGRHAVVFPALVRVLLAESAVKPWFDENMERRTCRR